MFIHICSKHVVLGVKCSIIIWESVPSSFRGCVIVDCILFLKYGFKLDKILLFS